MQAEVGEKEKYRRIVVAGLTALFHSKTPREQTALLHRETNDGKQMTGVNDRGYLRGQVELRGSGRIGSGRIRVIRPVPTHERLKTS